MPTYTYECKKCSHSVDVFHPMSASPRVKCPECGGACRKMLGSGSGVIFKGSGFYETDYKRSANSGASGGGKSESKSETKSESKSEGKTEGKTETKSESKSESKQEHKLARESAKKASGGE